MNELVTKLRKLNVEVSFTDGRLVVKADDGVVHKELLEEIRKNKEALIAYIRQVDRKSNIGSIGTASLKEHYVVSAAQRRLYFLHELNQGLTVYNLPSVIKLQGELHKERLEAAFHALVERHESLRTCFELVDGEPVQKVLPAFVPAIDYVEVEEGPEAAIDRFIRPFNLARAPLMRMGIAEVRSDEYLLLTDFHHIIADGVSFSLLISDFMALYKGEQLPPLPVQYKDFAEWQCGAQWQELVEKQRSFWLEEFALPPAALSLPTDRPRPLVKTYAGKTVGFEVDAVTTAALRSLAARSGATLFMTILSVYSVLAGRMGDQEDIVIGTPSSGRQHADLEKVIGMFVNTLCIRTYPRGRMTFGEYLQTVKEKTLACFDNQAYQYDRLVEDLKVPRDTGRNPLFDVMFVFQNFELPDLQIPGLQLQPYPLEQPTSKFDLCLFAEEDNGKLVFNLEYSTDLFDPETIGRFIQYFHAVIAAVIANPAVRLGDIDLLPASEQEQVIWGFNNTHIEYPLTESVMTLFEKRVTSTPEHIAIKYKDQAFTYRQLSVMSNKVAAYLKKEHGLQPGDLAGILLERGEYLVPVIFGILKAGAAYVPIDPAYPAGRVQAIVEQARLKVLLSHQDCLEAFTAFSWPVIDLKEKWTAIEHTTPLEEPVVAGSRDAAYVIFTSGSTGQPKGVVVEHHSLTNFICFMQDLYPLHQADRYLLKTTVTFDVSAAEIFGWFLGGGSLAILEPRAERDVMNIIDTIELQQVSHVNFVPSLFYVFLEELERHGISRIKSLRYISLAGEAVPPDMVRRFHQLKAGIHLENIYGPTEGTVYTTAYSIRPQDEAYRIPIGKPLPNIRCYILSAGGGLQPVNACGELYIGGEGLAKGYLNNDGLTDERFVKMAVLGEERVYKTGDRARWLPDGNIEYLGRIDEQIKLRGFRIELGEIENALCRHDAITEAVAVVKEKEGDKWLVAYYVAREAINPAVLKELLGSCLPGYMVPAFYVHLDRFPRHPNGKLNRKELPEPVVVQESTWLRPANEIQQKLALIWADVLKINAHTISMDANFFEIGGHSLNIMVLGHKINDAFNCHISVAQLFGLPTIRSIESFISGRNTPIGNAGVEIDEAINEANNNLDILAELLQ